MEVPLRKLEEEAGGAGSFQCRCASQNRARVAALFEVMTHWCRVWSLDCVPVAGPRSNRSLASRTHNGRCRYRCRLPNLGETPYFGGNRFQNLAIEKSFVKSSDARRYGRDAPGSAIIPSGLGPLTPAPPPEKGCGAPGGHPVQPVSPALHARQAGRAPSVCAPQTGRQVNAAGD